MIAGLGEAALLVVENMSQYHDSMRVVRDYLETQLAVSFTARSVQLTAETFIHLLLKVFPL